MGDVQFSSRPGKTEEEKGKKKRVRLQLPAAAPEQQNLVTTKTTTMMRGQQQGQQEPLPPRGEWEEKKKARIFYSQMSIYLGFNQSQSRVARGCSVHNENTKYVTQLARKAKLASLSQCPKNVCMSLAYGMLTTSAECLAEALVISPSRPLAT